MLWIDDFAPALELYKASMETFGFKIFTAASGEAGVKLAAMKRIDLVITDYARGRTPGSPDFERYIEKTGYHVIEPAAYGELLRAAGFENVVVDDATAKFVAILRSEIDRLVANRAEFLASFSESDLNALGQDGWELVGVVPVQTAAQFVFKRVKG